MSSKKLYPIKTFTDPLVIAEVSLPRISRHNSETFHEVEIIDPQTLEIYVTYVSPENYNAKRWIKALRNRELNKVTVIQGKIRTHKHSDRVIDADSDFKISEILPRDIFYDMMHQHHGLSDYGSDGINDYFSN